MNAEPPTVEVPLFRDATSGEIRDACSVAVRRTRSYMDPTRVVDAAVNLVAGYAMAELHRANLLAIPTRILEHARAAMAVA